MKKFIILMIMCMKISSHAQTDTLSVIPDSLISKQIKVFIFSYLNINQLSPIEFDSYMKKHLEIILLKSQGFDGIEFYQIPFQPIIEYVKDDKIIVHHMPIEYLDLKLIIARNSNTGRLFIITGLYENNLSYLLNNFSTYAAIECYRFHSKKKRVSCLWVDGLNLSELATSKRKYY